MDEKLLNYTIAEYLNLLKTGSNVSLCNEITDLLNSKIEVSIGKMDLHLFMMERNLLLYKCKELIAMLNLDEDKRILYQIKAKELAEEIRKYSKKFEKKKVDPYKSFIDWLLSLKKYYGSDIDQSNDLLYLVAATEQMLKFYASQEEQIQNIKSK